MNGVVAVVGLHVFTDAPLGTIEINAGPLMAAVDDFDLAILGQSAHGAELQKGVDAIVLAAQVLSTFQMIVARRIPAMEAGVITVGTIRGGSRRNVLAGRLAMEGTVCSFAPKVREALLADLKRACELALPLGGNYDEDFALYLERAPGIYFRLEVATPGQPLRRAHSPTFDLDERVLPLGAAMLAEIAWRWLASASVQEAQKA